MAPNSSEYQSPWFRRELSLRARVTLWIVLAFAVVKVTLVFVILLYQQRAIHSSFDSVFENRVSAVAQDLESHVGPIDVAYLRAVALRETNNLYIQDFSVLVYNTVENRSIANYGLEYDLFADLIQDIQSDEDSDTLYTTVTTETGPPLRAAARRIVLEGKVPAVLVLATSDRYTTSVSRTVGRIMLISTPFTIGTIAIVAWFVGGIAVRPLDQVRKFAENLNPEGLRKGIDLDESGSEVTAVEEQLDAAMNRLDDAYQTQARFLANISHEIKTPISVVQSEAEVLMMSKPETTEYAQFVRSTCEEMQRLGKMVESFLLLTRVQQGDSRIRRSRIGLNDVVMEAVEQCYSMARQYAIRLEPVLCSDEIEPTVFGNEDLLVTAINNLVRNAIRFSPEGEKVTVTCTKEGDDISVLVTDRGPGIPEDLLLRLFEPFTQASSERRRGRGTGLGLQIAKGIAELHGGDIKVENLDIGCQFTFQLTMSDTDEPK